MPRVRPFEIAALWPAILGILFAVCATVIGRHYGAWYDEIYTLVYVRHDMPLGSVVETRWLNDIHPPFFYFLGWLADPVIGDSVERGRALNIIYLGIPIVLSAVYFQRGGRERYFYPYFMIVALGCGLSLKTMIEFRSNMLSIALVSCVMLRLFRADRSDDPGRSREFPDLPVTTLCLSAAFFIHYITSIIVGVTVAVFIAMWWLRGRRRLALGWIGAAAIASIPVVAWWVIERRLTVEVAGTFWSTTTPTEARWYIERFVQSMILANILLAGLAVVAIAGRMRARDWSSPSLWFGIACGVASGAALAVLFVMNLRTSFIQPRYFAALIPVMAAGIAALASLMPRPALIAGLATAVGAITIATNAETTTKSHGWEESASIARIVAARCDDTAVHARSFYDMGEVKFRALPGEARVAYAGYLRAARNVGLAIEPAGGHRVSRRCPTLLWIEHWAPDDMSAAAMAQHAGLAVGATSAASARILRRGGGMVVVYPPDPTP